MIRGALTFRDMGLGEPILIGRRADIQQAMKKIDLPGTQDLIIEENTPQHPHAAEYADFSMSACGGGACSSATACGCCLTAMC